MASMLLQSPPAARSREALGAGLQPAPGSAPVDWRIAPGLVPYPAALAEMESRATAVARGEAPELAWLLEHPPLYTAGTGARRPAAARPGLSALHRVGRGGQLTYHGPGQRVPLRRARSQAPHPGCAALCGRASRKSSSSARLPPSTCAASAVPIASGCGSRGRTRAKATRTRSRRSASASAAG